MKVRMYEDYEEKSLDFSGLEMAAGLAHQTYTALQGTINHTGEGQNDIRYVAEQAWNVFQDCQKLVRKYNLK